MSLSPTYEEVGPTLPEEAGPTPSSTVGPTLLQGNHSAFDATQSVSLFQSMSAYIDNLYSASDEIDNWSHLLLPYAHASKLIQPHYDNIGRVFTERGSKNSFAIVDTVTSSAPKFKDQICFEFYDTSIVSTTPTLDDLYDYEEISSFLSDPNYHFTSKSFRYLKRRMFQFKACHAKANPTIPQAQQHKYAVEFTEALTMNSSVYVK